MKMDELQNAISLLEDELLTETGKARMNISKQNKFSSILKYSSVAACVCLLFIGSIVTLMTMSSHNSGPENEIIPENMGTSDGIEHVFADSSDDTILEGNKDVIENQPSNKGNDSEITESSSTEIPSERIPEEYSATVNLSAGILSADNSVTLESCDPLKYSITFSDYALNLFREVYKGKGNEMLSPLSVSYALGMAANGAKGETLSQLEAVLGMQKDEFNTFLRCYMNSLPNGEEYKLSTANSIWIRNTFCDNVSKSYLKSLINHYSAEVYTSPFNKETVNKLNDWVSHKTAGMINQVTDDLSFNDMVIINALSFEAKWDNEFELYNNSHGSFTRPDMSTVDAEYMSETLSPTYKNYIEDENVTGFIKYYKDQKYAFVALLPNDDVIVDEFVAELTGEKLNSLVSNAVKEDVYITLPKFEATYENYIKDSLVSLGATDAFNSDLADFSGISKSSPIYLSDVIHKTYIKVDEAGTKAAAMTGVFLPMGAEPEETETKVVSLKRPFFYMVIDCENSIPLFLGTVTDPTK